MTAEPCASARRVFWVADNGSSHRGQASIDRMAAAWPNAVLVHLPVHASWLNQVEIVFSIIQRKVIKPADIGDAAALATRLTRFQARYNTTARPFDWTFTRAGLNDLCRRIDAPQPRQRLAGRLTGRYWADRQSARLHQDQPRPETARPRPRPLAPAHRGHRPLPRQVRLRHRAAT